MSEQGLAAFKEGWPGEETVCGWGSTLAHTNGIRQELPRILNKYAILDMNDAGCGDLHWIQHVSLQRIGVDYHGYDLFERDTWPYLKAKGWKLSRLDIISQDMPYADLVMCRDVFIHLPNNLILIALERMKKNHKFLLATNFTSPGETDKDYAFDNEHRTTGISMKHSKIDLRLPPFNLGEPLEIVVEDYPYKTTSLWKLK